MEPCVHPTVVMEGEVTLEEGCRVGPFCYLRGPIHVGANSTIYPHCVIGTEGEHRSRGPKGVVRIGKDATIRELTVIQRGTGDHDTTVGDRTYVMDHCHIAHDVLIEDDVTMSPNVVLGGHTHVLRGATIGIAAVTHQFSTIGAFAMVGMGSVVTKDVPPLCLVAGNPARFRRFNTHVFEANGWTGADLKIADGALVSENPSLREEIARFAKACRRSVLELADQAPL